MEIKLKRWLDDYPKTDIKLPLATDGNACFDFYSPTKAVIYPGQTGAAVGTGIAVEIPDGYCMKLYVRSSYGAHRKLRLSNSVGIIDSSYRGEVKALFDNIGDMPEIIEKGERFIQGRIEPNIPVAFTEVATLSQTQRNTGGFGSTGKK